MKVFISSPSKSTMQSGNSKSARWILEYERVSKRMPEPLMGWVSSEDTLNQVTLEFDTKDQAIEYAIAKGWEYQILPHHIKKYPAHNYSSNFVYEPAEE